MRHVDADLVRAARLQPAFEQRGERVLGTGFDARRAASGILPKRSSTA